MNALLEKTKAGILAKADPRLAPIIQKVVAAGEKVMTSDQTRGMFVKQMSAGANPEAVGAGVAKLIGILQNQSKGSIPPEVLVKAATILMCEGLQLLEDAGKAQVTPQFLADCTKAMGSAVLQLLGATPEQLSTLLQKGGQPQGQPAQPAPQPAPQAPPPQGIINGAAQGVS